MSRAFAAVAVLAAVRLSGAPAWVQESNDDARVLIRAIGAFSPEEASSWGLAAYDASSADLGPGVAGRYRAALTQAKAALQADLAGETDPRVRQDLQIMIHGAEERATGSELNERYLLPYRVAGRVIFQGELTLLNDQAAPGRHAAAVKRLERYVGLAPGSTPLVDLAKARYEEKQGVAALLGPYRGELEQDIADNERFAKGVRQLFEKHRLTGGEAALAALDRQLAGYGKWLRTVVRLRARADFRPPAPLYAQDLRDVGIDLAPRELVGRAQVAFAEIQEELATLAPLVAASHGWPETDYRDVIRHLKREQLAPSEVEPFYRRQVIPRLEAMIREHRVATLPERAMAMRIASEAESAVQPAPHMQPPPLIDNHGEQGTFVLPLGNPAGAGKSDRYDDFTFKAGAWTLTAHEGRPGHELQYSRMVEGGVSQARSIFAFNSVNVEGWALYAEAEMKPYEPLDGQLIAVQLRLLRAVRAFSDPMLNLGLMTRERARELLVNDVCISEAFAREEVDRFTFRLPGQATSYFYGYTRLMQLRAATQVTLGAKFDRLAFNDFLVAQGLLPPDLLAEAVKTEFIPSQEKN